jgi:hypothetical protein
MVLNQVGAGGLAPQTPQQRAERRPPHLPAEGLILLSCRVVLIDQTK